ncbi:MAG: glycine oxidase ThiO [Ramlibacter sp.]|nr:glycine oxidase ThiO [Ramlibacter sp.]
MDRNSDVVVIGAGLIGLAVADELARRGRKVSVLDERPPHEAASWAGAGMLAPHPERKGSAGFESLCLRSFQQYPRFVADLIERTGIDPQLRTDGVLLVATSGEEAERLSARAHELKASGVEARWLDEMQARAFEPALGAQHRGAAFVAAGGQVDNRDLLGALETACLRAGVQIDRESANACLEVEHGRVRAVKTARARFAAPVVVNATGAWAGLLKGVPPGAAIPVSPVKGQMLALRALAPPVRRLMWLNDCYLVPGRGGRVLVGATIEQAGFDTRVTAAGVHQLLALAITHLPQLADAELIETWAGLRPGSPDGLPFLGVSDIEGYVLSGGHYRNGILLAPITALLIADLLDGKRMFRAGEFAKAAADGWPG